MSSYQAKNNSSKFGIGVQLEFSQFKQLMIIVRTQATQSMITCDKYIRVTFPRKMGLKIVLEKCTYMTVSVHI